MYKWQRSWIYLVFERRVKGGRFSKEKIHKINWMWGMDSLQLQSSAGYQTTILPLFHTNVAIVSFQDYKLVN